MIADSQAELYGALHGAGRGMAARPWQNTTMQAACCKLMPPRWWARVTDRAVQIRRAGYMSEYAVERFYRDVRLFRIFEGTSQIQPELVIARETIKAHSELAAILARGVGVCAGGPASVRRVDRSRPSRPVDAERLISS